MKTIQQIFSFKIIDILVWIWTLSLFLVFKKEGTSVGGLPFSTLY